MGKRGVKPQHVLCIRNEYKYIERNVTQREKETPAARREEVVLRAYWSKNYTHRHNSRSLARSFLLPRARAWHSLAGSCLPPPFFPPRVPYEGPAESQSTAQCPLGLRTPRAGRTKDETRFEKISMRVAPHLYFLRHSYLHFPRRRDERQREKFRGKTWNASSNRTPRSASKNSVDPRKMC